jgi:hypothetical protein
MSMTLAPILISRASEFCDQLLASHPLLLSLVESGLIACAHRSGRARAFFLDLFALALGPSYLPTTRLTTMAAMPASTALAIGDDRMSVIGLDPDACC